MFVTLLTGQVPQFTMFILSGPAATDLFFSLWGIFSTDFFGMTPQFFQFDAGIFTVLDFTIFYNWLDGVGSFMFFRSWEGRVLFPHVSPQYVGTQAEEETTGPSSSSAQSDHNDKKMTENN